MVAYEVGPFRDTSIHVIGTHFAPKCFNQNFAIHPPVDKEENLKDHFTLEKLGLPLVSNFDSTLTCQKVWQYLWNQVSRFVLDIDGKNDVQTINKIMKGLNIRVVDQHGNPKQVFSNEPNLGSLLPRNSSTPILNLLGNDAIDNFLFISFEWMHLDTTDTNKRDRQRFEFVQNHPSHNQRKLHGNVITLDQCFSTFTRPERLDEQNKWYCSNCRDHVRAMKTMQLWNLPDVLVIHLKRFDHKHTRTKLDTLVDFPLENLNINPFCESNSSTVDAVDGYDNFVQDYVPANYDLFAVINHYGKMGFGHYTAFARQYNRYGIMDTSWRCFDDSSVGNIKSEMVVSSAAYVLFYKRVVREKSNLM